MTPDRAFCIHGHYYQPPRENPWRESVPVQDSASPFHDWNERIADECYAPNARTRLLDGEGRVRRVMNTYARTSFNLGPTLLSWMEDADPDTYREILDADQDSMARFSGHGAAIAQAYGHAILPLASRRDKETQVRWGIRDFEVRFRRRPEALWMPETAVDIETLEVLAQEGMRYAIVAPHQVLRARPMGSAAWRVIDSSALDTTMPYLARLPSGASMALYAYDGAIAHAVSFGDLLENGDRFLARLLSASPRDGGLVHIATDGETYGHHHRFGEMALAYVLEKLEALQDVRVTNYAEWLDAHPPTHEAEIAPNTSWSCAHGVERWRSDCGCTTYSRPGWTQAWRAPLRRAVDELNNRLDETYASRAGKLLRDPWAARDSYIDVVLDAAAADSFLDTQSARRLNADERSEVLRLLEMQRHRLLASTSCGWYFADLAGIEAVQVLRYAARAIELAEGLGERGIEESFVDRIAEAESNDPRQGDGRAIYERLVRSARVDAPQAVKEEVAATLFDREATASPGIAVGILEQTERRTMEGRLVAGRARVMVRRTRETSDVAYAGVRGGSGVPHVGAASSREDAAHDAVRRFDRDGSDAAARGILEAFPAPVRLEEVLSPRGLADLEADAAARALASVEDGTASLALLADPRIAHSGALRGLALFALHRRLTALARSLDGLGTLEVLLEQARAASLPVSGDLLAHEIGRTLARELATQNAEALTPAAIDLLTRGASRARALAPDVNLWRAQEAYLQVAGRLGRGDAGRLDVLGNALGVRLGDAVL
jgi:alpha-amylase/alpha-mannosidase (GH57 family)